MTINRILDECEKRIDYLLFLIKDIDDKMIYASSKEKDKLIRKRAILLHEKIMQNFKIEIYFKKWN